MKCRDCGVDLADDWPCTQCWPCVERQERIDAMITVGSYSSMASQRGMYSTPHKIDAGSLMLTSSSSKVGGSKVK